MSKQISITPIHNDDDLRVALREVSTLMDLDPEVGTPKGDLLEILSTLIEAYESKHFQIDAPDPVEAIRFRMDQQGLSPKDLAPMIGGVSRVYEILNRTRPLTLRMIRNLNVELGIPAEVLIH